MWLLQSETVIGVSVNKITDNIRKSQKFLRDTSSVSDIQRYLVNLMPLMEVRKFTCNMLSENCYAVSEGGHCVLFDPGFWRDEERDELYSYLTGLGVEPEAILLTHGHFDHVFSAKLLQERFGGIPVYMGPADEAILPDDVQYAASLGIRDFDPGFKWTPVTDGQVLSFGEPGDVPAFSFKAIATPGHTPGGICWYCEAEQMLFSGDTLFADTIGRTDFPYGSYDDEIRSIMEKVILLPGSTDVFPGHGHPTTIARERSYNPFLEPFNEPEEVFDEDLPGIEIHR